MTPHQEKESENIYWFDKHANKNEQRSVQQELDKLFPSTIGRRRGEESRELHRVGVDESSASLTIDTNTSFATPSTTKRMIVEIWGLESSGSSSQICYFFHVKPSDFSLLLGLCEFSSLVFHDCRSKFLEQEQELSYFQILQSHPKGI